MCLFAMLTGCINGPIATVPFNVWINLPTFDPNGGGDVVRRLVRDGRVNIILGFALPFVMPVVGVWRPTIWA
jgi:ABC-type microcin C transport system permease subunit YejE